MKNLKPARLIFASIIIFSLFANADLEKPARDIVEVSKSSIPTSVKRVTTARVIIADYALIRRDFSYLRDRSDLEIDQWILKNTALISQTQVHQSIVNTQISVSAETRTAQRPPDYNRALVFEVLGGLIDGKGFGSINPRQADHGNGLATLGEMLREFLYQKLVQKIFDISASGLKTVGSYAVIDWGFREVHADGSSSQAGAILRQAHRRAKGTYSLLDDATTLKIELLLRKYGVTTAGAYRASSFERLNVQGTSDGGIIDFGGYLAVDRFTKPIKSFYGIQVLQSPDMPGFIQPDPLLRVPLEMWGTTVSGVEDPKLDNPWLWSHELAEALSTGKASREDVDRHLRNFLDPVEGKFQSYQARLCSRIFQ